VQVNYNAAVPGIRSQIAALQGDVHLLRSQETAIENKVHATATVGWGLLAQETALDQLAAQATGVKLTIWLIRLAIVLIALAPVLVKLLAGLAGQQVYDEIAEAVQERYRAEAR